MNLWNEKTDQNECQANAGIYIDPFMQKDSRKEHGHNRRSVCKIYQTENLAFLQGKGPNHNSNCVYKQSEP